MLKSTEYFRGISCPSEADGKGCFRPYCPFRHQTSNKHAASSTSLAKVDNTNITIESVNNAIEKLKSDIASGSGTSKPNDFYPNEYNPMLNESYTPEPYLSYNEQTSAANLYTPSSSSSGHAVNYYPNKVTKSVLHGAKGASNKVQNKVSRRNNSKNIYNTNKHSQPATDMEYDPVVNFSTSKFEKKQSNTAKRNHSEGDDIKIPEKKSKLDEYSEFDFKVVDDNDMDEDGLVINEDLGENLPDSSSTDGSDSVESEPDIFDTSENEIAKNVDDSSLSAVIEISSSDECNLSDKIPKLNKTVKEKLKNKSKTKTTSIENETKKVSQTFKKNQSKSIKSPNKNSKASSKKKSTKNVTLNSSSEKSVKAKKKLKKKLDNTPAKKNKSKDAKSSTQKEGKNGIIKPKDINITDITTYIGRDEIKELEKDLEDGDRYEECLRIFHEGAEGLDHSSESCDSSANEQDSVSTEVNTSSESLTHATVEVESAVSTVGKRRVAHVNASLSAVSLRKPLIPRKRISTPAQQMMQRLKILEQEKKANASSSSSTRVAHKLSGRMASLAKGVSNSPTQTRPNLAKLEKRIQQNPWYPGKDDEPTVCGTATKGVARVAHQSKDTVVTKNGNVIPSRPRIGVDRYSKVPTNIRQRYLSTFIDEGLRIFNNNHEKAYAMAQMEEENVKKRSNTKNIYLSLAASTLKKLRDKPTCEVKEYVEQKPEESIMKKSNKRTGENVLKNKKSSKVMSHDRLLDTNTKKCKGGYTIEKKEEKSKLSSSDMYETMCRYILTPEQLDENGYPRPCDEPGKTEFKSDPPPKPFNTSNKKICAHCGKEFFLDKKGNFSREEECIHHWGRAYMTRVGKGWEKRYSCCQERLGSEGCTVGDTHVHADNKLDRSGYVSTLMKSPPPDGNAGVYTLDCEMSYTVNGLELTRVSVLDTGCKLVYDTLVKPSGRVLDYNTRWSGITEDDMKNVKTTIRDVQAAFLTKFSADTILMGHSLESDLIALRIIHETVIDTSVVFPHKRGFPYKRALRTLCSEFLGLVIQNMASEGHDSAEDASACMKLMLWKVEEDSKLSHK